MTTLLTNDTAGADFEADAETQRATAFRATRYWHDLPLLWTISRETLWYWLRTPPPRLSSAAREARDAAKAAEGSADHAVLLARANALIEQSLADNGPDNSHFRNASIMLWLCAHKHEDWQHLSHDRKRFLIEIEQWADENIHTSELLALSDITNQLVADAESTRAICRPVGHKSVEVGN